MWMWLLGLVLLASPCMAQTSPPLQQFFGLPKEVVKVSWQDIGADSYQLHCMLDGAMKVQQAYTSVQAIDVTTFIDQAGNWACSVTALDVNSNIIDTDSRSFGVWESSPGVLEIIFKVGP